MKFAKTLLTIGSIIGAREAIRAAQVIDLDDLLGVIGLERRRGRAERILPALAMVAVSAAVGAGAALLLAPSAQLRGGSAPSHLGGRRQREGARFGEGE
jgi:hypothetical protein